MIAIGTDIEDISRFKNKSLEKDYKFLNRLFTEHELNYCFKNRYPHQHLCARFCAKEAIIKAICTKIGKKPKLKEIEIVKYQNGSIEAKVHNKEFQNLKISITISHEKEKAIAFCIIE